MSNKITELENDIQQWISFNKDKEYQIYLLEQELKEYRKLQSEVHTDIEKVWMYDSSLQPLTDKQKLDSISLIYKVFYKIGNEWIGGEGLETQKRTDPERWESLEDMDGSWTDSDIEKGNHLPF
jgi:hypothetical protein